MSKITKNKTPALFDIKLLLLGIVISSSAAANDFNAEKVMKQMTPDERYGYLAGVIEGLAIARYNKDGKKKEGMNCIYDWFYDDKQNRRVIYDAFEKYPTYPPGSIVDVLVKKKCGE
jgi:hypothetical protein